MGNELGLKNSSDIPVMQATGKACNTLSDHSSASSSILPEQVFAELSFADRTFGDWSVVERSAAELSGAAWSVAERSRSNHLVNVYAVISDRKLGMDDDSDNNVGDFTPTHGLGSVNPNAITCMAKPVASGISGNLFVSMFNGNIGYQSIASKALMNTVTDVNNYVYEYDQLNRLVNFDVIKGINPDPLSIGEYNWATSSKAPDYASSYLYDGNGNILNLVRNGNNPTGYSMDQLVYDYYPGTNRLKRVEDQQLVAQRYDNDFENMIHDFEYDEIGNLTKDEDEEIEEISWNLMGKVTGISRTTGSTKPDLQFAYDAMGNRTLKSVIQPGMQTQQQHTFYVRDAQGNPMATYGYSLALDPNSNSGYDAIIQLLQQNTSPTQFTDFFETNYWSNTNYSNELLQYLSTNDNGYILLQPFSLTELFGLNSGYLANTLAIYDPNALTDLFLTHSKTYYINTLMAADPLKFIETMGNYNLNNLLNAIDNSGSPFVIDQVHMNLFPGSPPMTTAQKIADLTGFSVTTAQVAQQLVSFTTEVANAILTMSNNDIQNAIFMYYIPSTGIAAALSGYGNSTTNIGVLDQYDHSNAVNFLVIANGYQNILGALKTTYSSRLFDQIAFTHPFDFGKGFEGISGFTPFDLLDAIENDLGPTVRQNIENQLGNIPLDLVRTYTLEELNIYGSSRLGTRKQAEILYTESFRGTTGADYWQPVVNEQYSLEQATVETEDFSYTAGKMRYELSNHLGNVYTVISDRKLGVDDDNNNQVDYFEADMASAQDYYAFGSIMPGRQFVNASFEGDGYRYGFNGMEADNELKGSGNSYTTEFRQYDPRLGRWLSLDPLMRQYPSHSDYHFGFNNPLRVVDTDGAENIVVVGNQGESPSSDKVPWYKRIFGGSEYRYGENKRHFLEAGLNTAKELKRNHTDNDEETSLLVYKGDYTDEEIAAYKKRAEKAGIKFQVVNSADDVKSYVNESGGYIHGKKAPEGRSQDLVTDFSYVGHGNNESFLLGYGHSGQNNLFGADFKTESFSLSCDAWLLGCGNGLDIFDDFKTKMGGNVFGYTTTVIWGANGLGSYAPFNMEYMRGGLLRAIDYNRKELKPEERFRLEKGSRTE